MASNGEDARAVRTAGVVLIGIGAFAFVVALLWNLRGGEFDREALVSVNASVVATETRMVKTKTSHDDWIIVDVRREIAGAMEPERWIFPTYSKKIESGIAGLEADAEVTGLLASDPVFVRWHDGPVRILWALSEGEEVLAPVALVKKTEEDDRYASPVIGIATIGLGLVIVALSRQSRRSRAAEPGGA